MTVNAQPKARLRLVSVLFIGPIAFILLFAAFAYYYKTAPSGIAGWLADAFKYQPIREFAQAYALRILLPFYTLAGIVTWLLTLLPVAVLDRNWLKSWRSFEVMALGLSAMLWMNLLLWWEVPSTLWVIPGIRQVPFLALFPLLTIGALAYPIYWLSRRRHLGLMKQGAVLGIWLLSWSSLALAPAYIPRPRPDSVGGDEPCQMLMLGVDGLRSDTFLEQVGDMQGIRYQNAYTPIPATRLLWHILWGGDPLFYTVGHVGPSLEEYKHPETLSLLQEAKEKGWRPRFYIDDGGTIGLAQRVTPLDDTMSPAEGWENFVNSNIATSFPLYGAWENWFKVFPTTNPWASLDEGLKEALRLGRGSKWVMFHSCLAHQPIFLTRKELATITRWWALPPDRLKPQSVRQLVSKDEAMAPDKRGNPFQAYRLRMNSILRAWEPIWNGLSSDPMYKGAVRSLFSDHGERFHNVGPNGFQLQGIHGYNLDPWECRAALLMAGPGFSEKPEPTVRQASVSLLAFRDGVHSLIQRPGSFDAKLLESLYPQAPMRYHTLDRSFYVNEDTKYRELTTEELASQCYIADKGVWLMEYSKPASERAQDVSIGLGQGMELKVWKPLKDGGAHLFRYQGYQLQELTSVDEKAFQAARQEVEKLLPGTIPSGSKPASGGK